ncbi:MAG: hypothetical protein MUP81_02405 [Dehalococcoidia bacterium]|nr:hypothetical protein [Dehalococcoidia bacterium]
MMDEHPTLAIVLWIVASIIFVLSFIGTFWPWLKRIGLKPFPITSGKLVGIEYYQNRAELGIVQKEFADVKKAWVLWYTAKGVIENGVYLHGKIKKMMFVHPDCNFEEPVKKYIRNCVLDKRSPENEAESIREGTEKVHQEAKRIEIRWLKEIPEYFFVINNPDSEDAWVRIESFDLTKNAKDWHSYRIYRREHQYLFEVLKRKYEQLWQRSEIKYGGAKEKHPKEEGKKGRKT